MWGYPVLLFFAWIPPLLLLRPPRPSAAPPSQLITAPLLTSHLSQHNSSTSITSLISAQLITAPLLTPHLSHLHFSHHLSHLHFSRPHFIILSQHNSSQLRGPQTAFAWQAQYTEPPGGAAARVVAAGAAAATSLITAQLININHLTYHSTTHHSSTSHTSLITSSLLTAPLHHIITAQLTTAPWSSDCLSRGRRSTQSLLEELRRAWSPLGPRLPFAWQAQFTEPPGRAAARVVAAGAAAAFRVAGAVHRASWRSCALGPQLPFSWQAQYTQSLLHGGGVVHVVAAGAAAAFLVAGAVRRTSCMEELRRSCLSRGRRAVHRASWSSSEYLAQVMRYKKYDMMSLCDCK